MKNIHPDTNLVFGGMYFRGMGFQNPLPSAIWSLYNQSLVCITSKESGSFPVSVRLSQMCLLIDCVHLGSAMEQSVSGLRASDCRFHGPVGLVMPGPPAGTEAECDVSLNWLGVNHSPNERGSSISGLDHRWGRRDGDWIDGLRHLFLDIVKGQMRWFVLDRVYFTAGLGTP